MPFPAPLSRALVAAAGGVLGLTLLAPAPAPAVEGHKRPAPDDTPLAVTIDAMTPGAVPRKGRILVSGTLTNVDDTTWTDINLYSFLGPTVPGTGVATPMTTPDELAAAAATGTADYVGERITEPGDYATITELAPGQSVPYSFSVPRNDLPVLAGEGVYWFGVHALGSNEEGRDIEADGRARTFLPMLAPRRDREPVRAALVLPIRKRVLRQPDGSIADVESWTRALAPGGRLADLVDLGGTGQGKATWLVDPAVIDAAHALAAGNPPRFIGPTVDVEEPAEEAGEESPGASPPASPEAEPEGSPTPEPTAEEVAAADAAAAWLERWESAVASSEVLALPYGDIDLTAVAEHGPELYAAARERSEEAFAAWGIPATPADAPYTGYADDGALALGDPETPVLLADRAFPGADLGEESLAEELDPSATESPSETAEESPTPTTTPETGEAVDLTTIPAVAQAGGRRVLLAATGAAEGGPEPGDVRGAVPLRQRILAEAAVRALSGERTLVVAMGPTWNPSGSATGFFEGLDLPWLSLSALSSATAIEPPVPVDAEQLQSPQSLEPLSEVAITATEQLMATGRTFQRVLTRNDQVAAAIEKEALTSAAYTARGGTGAAALSSQSFIQRQLRRIRVESAPRITLSSERGRFSATVVNDLDQPVTVRLEALTDGGLEIDTPDEIQVAPHSRAAVTLSARAGRNGVHDVTLALTDTDGRRLGSTASVPVRVGQVSDIIWLFLVTGGALLFGAIGVRLFRRIRAAGRPEADADEPGSGAPGAPSADADQHAEPPVPAP